jgi:hypothetical protein
MLQDLGPLGVMDAFDFTNACWAGPSLFCNRLCFGRLRILRLVTPSSHHIFEMFDFLY